MNYVRIVNCKLLIVRGLSFKSCHFVNQFGYDSIPHQPQNDPSCPPANPPK